MRQRRMNFHELQCDGFAGLLNLLNGSGSVHFVI
jgi:hypothetical protein